jgi:excisionase family DNA binding protein
MYALIKAGEVASVQVGRLRRIPVGALDTFTARLLSAQDAA